MGAISPSRETQPKTMYHSSDYREMDCLGRGSAIPAFVSRVRPAATQATLKSVLEIRASEPRTVFNADSRTALGTGRLVNVRRGPFPPLVPVYLRTLRLAVQVI